jgi:hypothetical protein
MSVIRKNLTFKPEVLRRADAIMRARGIDVLVDLVATLIREDYEKRLPSETMIKQLVAEEEAALRAGIEHNPADPGHASQKPLPPKVQTPQGLASGSPRRRRATPSPRGKARK